MAQTDKEVQKYPGSIDFPPLDQCQCGSWKFEDWTRCALCAWESQRTPGTEEHTQLSLPVAA